MVYEKKLRITEELRCTLCGRRFVQDVLWNRDFRIRARRTRLAEEEFSRLCPEHRFELYAGEIASAYTRGIIFDRDIEKMGVGLERLWSYLKLRR
ncbi:MAG: hypothetical protein GXO66_05565 [Euryarchaeota archaeon]|nr:hypothetical protein [Euryarchaeota archaeon]